MAKINKNRIIADTLLNSFEFMSEQEMIESILSIGNYDKQKITKFVEKWYSCVEIRMKMEKTLNDGWDLWLNREIGTGQQ